MMSTSEIRVDQRRRAHLTQKLTVIMINQVCALKVAHWNSLMDSVGSPNLVYPAAT
jgi:hypothetical protein